MAFQKKHWFDNDINIKYFDWVLDGLFPGIKVGMSMDMAPSHISGRVAAYFKQKYDEGRLVVGFINGGLTSVLQVCDLVANKTFKAQKKLYLRFRDKFIKAERAKTPDQPIRCIKIKVQIVKLTEIVEEATKIFNIGQRTNSSIEKNVRSAGQDLTDSMQEGVQLPP